MAEKLDTKVYTETISPRSQSEYDSVAGVLNRLRIVLYISLVLKIVKICLKFTFYQIFV